MFQFQLGAIGRMYARWPAYRRKAFQFQLGAIGRKKAKKSTRKSNAFQFQLGAIGSNFTNQILMAVLSFNSSLVRLGVQKLKV